MFIKEYLETKVTDFCDVLVCGGGIAGIAAALAAARHGKKVILLEKQFMLGGLGTAGLVTVYLPLCDGCGKQVSFGIAEELFRLSVSMGAEDLYPENWLDSGDPSKRTVNDKRFLVQYNPCLFAVLAEQLLTENGVAILYGSYAVGVSKTDDRIEAVLLESKSGRQAITAGAVVDATGDCDLAFFAGLPTETFRQGNGLAAWYYSLGREGYKLNMVGFSDLPDGQNAAEPLMPERFTGLDGKELSRMMQLSHQETMRHLLQKREADRTQIPTSMATIPQIRMTRRLSGEYTLSEDEAHNYAADSVGMVSDWRKRGPVYEVPFSSLYSAKLKNLITAGRCVSVTDGMWDIIRAIPCCAVTGQAAGTAAALSDDFCELQRQIGVLQRALAADGVVLHEKELP